METLDVSDTAQTVNPAAADRSAARRSRRLKVLAASLMVLSGPVLLGATAWAQGASCG